MSRLEIQSALGLKHLPHLRDAYLVPAIKQGLLEMTIPEKPQSRLQKYRLTPAGKTLAERLIIHNRAKRDRLLTEQPVG